MSFKVRIPVELLVTYGADVEVTLSHDEYQEYIQGKDIKELVSVTEVSTLYDKYADFGREFMYDELNILWDESMPE
jgi:hypothetical protein